MRVGFLGPALAGCRSTLESLARHRGVEATYSDRTVVVGDFEFRSGRGNEMSDYHQDREALITWSDALVITLDVQPEQLENNRYVLERFRPLLIGKPRTYQINKIDLRSGDWLLPLLPELGWEPRMDVVQTSMRHVHDRAAKPIGLDALWKAIERMDPSSS